VGAAHVESFALCGLGVALVNAGACDEGLPLLRHALEMAHDLRLSAMDFHRAYANLSTGLQICGDLEGSVAIALEGVDWAKRHGLWQLQGAFMEANAAQALVELGRWDEASALLHQRTRPIVEGVASLNHALVSAPLLLRRGDVDGARAAITRAYEQLEGLEDAQFTGPVSATVIELALAEGRAEEALAIADEALARMADTEETGARYRAEILTQAVEADARLVRLALGARDEAAAGARRTNAQRRHDGLLSIADGPLGPARGFGGETLAHVAMGRATWHDLAHGPDPTGWLEAATRWRELGRPYPLAVCLARAAEATLARRGARTDAADLLGEAWAIARRLGAVPLAEWCGSLARMGRLRMDDGPAGSTEPDEAIDAAPVAAPAAFGLTDRELDVIALLVQGYSNRRIGETLFMSESTAGVHVSNIIGKLGVANRVEAAALAVRTGLVD
jgi:ATP/maltotriose-dependent transcriptional regulator MalT